MLRFNMSSQDVTKLQLYLTCIIVVISLLPFGHGSFRRKKPHSQMLAEQISMSVNSPKNVHIAFGTSPSDIVVMWSTKLKDQGYIEYGDSPRSFKKTMGNTTELTESSDHSLKFIHRAEMKSLVPGKRYSYRIVIGKSETKSKNFFVNVPHNGSKKPHNFMVIADTGLLSKDLLFLIHEALNNKYETVFHIGDIAYNLNTEGGSFGDKFLNKIQKFAAEIPYMTTPGDHERFLNFHHYRHRFSLPNLPWPMEEKMWYSIDIGLAHFISIDTEALFNSAAVKEMQLKWLKQDLTDANKNRQNIPWIIVMGHKPMYCTKSLDVAQDCQKNTSIVRNSLEDLFFEQGVDLYLSGHKHCYERTWPTYRERVFQTSYVQPKAPIYIIIGAMGYEYLTDKQLSKEYWLAFASADREKELFARLGVINSTCLIWSVHAASNNEEVDTIHIFQNQHGSFGEPGQAALEKLKSKTNTISNLPPQPFVIIDELPASYTVSQFRRLLIFVTVFSLSLLLFIFLRHSRFRKVVKIPCNNSK